MIHTYKMLTESRHFRIDQVTEGVYAAISNHGTGSVGNAAIIDLGDAVLVVDTFSTIEAAKNLEEAAKQLTGKPVTHVVNTHWHSDHTSGNQVFCENANIISTSLTYEVMNTFGKNRLSQHLTNRDSILQTIDEQDKQLEPESDEKLKMEIQWENASDREYMKMLPQLVYTLPDITFDQQMNIYGQDRTVQLITYGGGHTQSDAFVYLPDERIAVMGDLVLSKHHPVMMYANPEEWLHILERIELLDVDTIIPGHGEVCSLNELYEVKQYIRDIVDLVKDAIQHKHNIEDLLIPEAYQEWYFRTYFTSNLKRVYDLLTREGV